MKLPSIGVGNVQNLANVNHTPDTSTQDTTALIRQAGNVIYEYTNNRDKDNEKALGISLNNKLSSANAKLTKSDFVNIDTLNQFGVVDFENDPRGEIPTYEAMPFVKKAITDRFIEEKKHTFRFNDNKQSWVNSISGLGLQQFNNDLSIANKIAKKQRLNLSIDEIGVSQQNQNFGMASLQINQLPKDLQPKFRSKNKILKEKSDIFNQIASGTDEQLLATLENLGKEDYKGLPNSERVNFQRRLRSEMTRRSRVGKARDKAVDMRMTNSIKEIYTGVKKGDKSSIIALDRLREDPYFDEKLLTEKQRQDLNQINWLRLDIENLRSMKGDTERKDYISQVCEQGSLNCNDIKVLYNADEKLMTNDTVQYALNSGVVDGYKEIDFQGDNAEIVNSIYNRMEIRDTLTEFTGHQATLLSNDEAVNLNIKIDAMEAEDRVSFIASTLHTIGGDGFLMLSEQIGRKTNSNYHIGTTLMRGNTDVAIGIAKGKGMNIQLPPSMIKTIEAQVTKLHYNNHHLIPSTVEAVKSLMKYEYSKDGDTTDGSFAKQDGWLLNSSVDEIEEYVEQVTGRRDDIYGSEITLPDMKITGGDVRDWVNNIDPSTMPEPNDPEITAQDVAEGLKGTTLIHHLSPPIYSLIDSSIPGTYFVVDTGTGKALRAGGKKGYKIKYDVGNILPTLFEKGNSDLRKGGL